MSNTIWKPQPRQVAFQSRAEDEVLYGGAAGGGKSDAILTEALRQVNNKYYKALIVRKTFPQLSDLIDKSRELYGRAFPNAKYNESQHVWTFPSGAKIIFGSMHHKKDKEKYQGKQYDFIAFDELTHFTWEEYSYLMSRNRASGTGTGTRVYMRATTNPGGIGHGWVKARFIDAAPPFTTIWEDREVYTPDGKVLKKKMSRAFIPATVFDNQALLNNDPDYIFRLDGMPEKERRALLYGDWDSFSGQVFTEWKNDPEHYEDRVGTHVISPFKVPDSWKIWRGLDWGFTRPFSVGWYAIDHEGRMYRIREFYGTNGTPNVGLEMNAEEVARQIVEIEKNDPNLKGRKIIGIADPAITQRQSGESIADLMAREGVVWDGADNTRIPGKMQVHYRLAFDDSNRPKLYIFNTCKHFIRTVPNLVYSESNVEDVDTDGEDHIYDELRYVCMANPTNAPIKKKADINGFDPLSTEDLKPYSFGMKYI